MPNAQSEGRGPRLSSGAKRPVGNPSPGQASSTALASVPFVLKRSSTLLGSDSYTTTRETAHGLLRLQPERLVVQWRTAVRTESIGSKSWTSKDEIEPAQEVAIPLGDVSSATVPRSRWGPIRAPRLVLTVADLVAFDQVAGRKGLRSKHPAKLVLRIKRADRLLAEEFAAELMLARARLAEGAGASVRLAALQEAG